MFNRLIMALHPRRTPTWRPLSVFVTLLCVQCGGTWLSSAVSVFIVVGDLAASGAPVDVAVSAAIHAVYDIDFQALFQVCDVPLVARRGATAGGLGGNVRS